MKLATRIFNRSDWYVTSAFGYRIHPITGKKSFHYGTDYGTHVQPWKQYALEDGVVVAVRTGKKDKDGSGYGNYVKIKYPRLGIRVLHAHLKSVNVKLGQNVTHDTCIGITGMTGTATGIHLHLGLQTTTSDTWLNPHEYDYQEFSTVNGVPRNEEVDQLQVKINNLRVRKEPSLSGDILGFVVKNDYYNDLETKEADNYIWHRIADGMWSANDKESKYMDLLPKEESKEIKLGDTVIVNGVGTASSTGGGAKTRKFVNQEMKVIMISGNTSRPNRYGLNQYNKGKINDGSAVTGWFSEKDIKKK